MTYKMRGFHCSCRFSHSLLDVHCQHCFFFLLTTTEDLVVKVFRDLRYFHNSLPSHSLFLSPLSHPRTYEFMGNYNG